MKILITGSQGFIGSYLCGELLAHGYSVLGVDNFSKYGEVNRAHDRHPGFELSRIDVRDPEFDRIVDNARPEMIIAGAALIGGISYFHKYAYDLLATNERILARTFDAAIRGFKAGTLGRVVVLSSSMVFERATQFPTPESALETTPPPMSTYGFQKLASEYFAKGAWEQYRLPYTILRPFNCVGVGEDDALGEAEVSSGNVKLMLSHVLPDLVNKTLKGQSPLRILGSGSQTRCYTNGRDLARGVRAAVESHRAVNNDFNLSTSRATTVLELAELIWRTINPAKPFEYVCDEPFQHDVQMRVPDVGKAKELLGFEATITLEESVSEVIGYMREKGGLLERAS